MKKNKKIISTNYFWLERSREYFAFSTDTKKILINTKWDVPNARNVKTLNWIKKPKRRHIKFPAIQPECKVSAGLRSRRLLGQHASFIRLRRQEKDFNWSKLYKCPVTYSKRSFSFFYLFPSLFFSLLLPLSLQPLKL